MINSKAKIISIGYAVPEQSYTQDEIFRELGYPAALKRLFSKSEIERRHFWVPLERITKLSWQEQEEEYIKGAVTISKQAILNCLDGREVGDIRCIVYCSCTGFCPGPTISHFLSKELGFHPSTYHTNIGSMGCEGGFPGLKRAYDFTSVSGKPSLIVACELSSCSYFPEPDGKPDRENHFELARSNALFADAAASVLVGFDDDPRHPIIVDTETYTNTEYINDLGYVWRDGRLRVLLSRKVPELAPKVVKPAVDILLERNRLSIKDIEWFVIHSAGSTVLDNMRDALGISEEKMALSRKTLRLYGNTSSTSVGITGKMLMEQPVKSGDYAMVLSVGPGMTGGASLLHFLVQ